MKEIYGQRLRPAPAVYEIFLLGEEKGDRKDHVERIWPACETFTPAAPSCSIGSKPETNFMVIEVVDIMPQAILGSFSEQIEVVDMLANVMTLGLRHRRAPA